MQIAPHNFISLFQNTNLQDMENYGQISQVEVMNFLLEQKYSFFFLCLKKEVLCISLLNRGEAILPIFGTFTFHTVTKSQRTPFINT